MNIYRQLYYNCNLVTKCPMLNSWPCQSAAELQTHLLPPPRHPQVLGSYPLPLSVQLSNSANPQLWKVFICNENISQYTLSCTGTLRSRHSRLIFSGKWKATTHITRWKCITIQFTTWFWQHTSACMYEICLNHFMFSSYGLSVVSIDYSVFKFSYRFGLAVLFLCRDRRVPVQLCAYCGVDTVQF